MIRLEPQPTISREGGSWGLAGQASGFPSFPNSGLGYGTKQRESTRITSRYTNPTYVYHYLTKFVKGFPLGKMDVMFNDMSEPSAAVNSGVHNAASMVSVSMVNAILQGCMPLASGKYLDKAKRDKLKTTADVSKLFKFVGVCSNLGPDSNMADAEVLERGTMNIVVAGLAEVFNYWAWCPFFIDVAKDPRLKDTVISPSKIQAGCDLYFILRKITRSEAVNPNPLLLKDNDVDRVRPRAANRLTSDEKEEMVWQFHPVIVAAGAQVPHQLYKDGTFIRIGTFDNHRVGTDIANSARDEAMSQCMSKYMCPVEYTDVNKGVGQGSMIHWAHEAITDPSVTQLTHGQAAARMHGIPVCEIHVRS